MAFPFSSHLIIHARLAKPCRHKKGEKKKTKFFVSATHATLIAYWLSLLTTCRPQKQIPLAAVHLSGAREKDESIPGIRNGTLGWVEKESTGKKNVPVKPRCLRRRGSLMWHIQNSADKQGSGPLLLLIKGAVVLHQTAPSFSSVNLALRGVFAAKSTFGTLRLRF